MEISFSTWTFCQWKEYTILKLLGHPVRMVGGLPNFLSLLCPWEKMKMGTAAWVAMLLAMGLFIRVDTLKALPKNNVQNTPSYSGFADIQATKDSFIVVGDTQGTSRWEFWRERNDRERKLIVDEITRREPAFVIHLGDLTTRGSSKKHWQQFDEMHNKFRKKKIPCFPILGNHEFYGNDKKALENYFRRFPHLGQRQWYSLTWENVGLVMADSNFSKLTGEQREQQSRWYLAQLEKFEKNTGIDFVIVCCHEPPFTNSRVVGPNKEVRVDFSDPFIRSQKTRLFFSGHSHSYERFQTNGKFFIVSGGSGGPRHQVMIDPRKQRSQDLFCGPERRFFHFCEIENHHDTLVFKVLRLESDETFSEVDPFVIPKIRR
jgi:predicted phosphodiesterase